MIMSNFPGLRRNKKGPRRRAWFASEKILRKLQVRRNKARRGDVDGRRHQSAVLKRELFIAIMLGG
jgi:hypothetical protein